MINVFRPLHPSGFLSCSDRRLRLDSPGGGAEANKRDFFHATAVAMPRHASMAAPNVDAHAVPSLPLLEYRNPLPYETSSYLQIMSMWVCYPTFKKPDPPLSVSSQGTYSGGASASKRCNSRSSRNLAISSCSRATWLRKVDVPLVDVGVGDRMDRDGRPLGLGSRRKRGAAVVGDCALVSGTDL